MGWEKRIKRVARYAALYDLETNQIMPNDVLLKRIRLYQIRAVWYRLKHLQSVDMEWPLSTTKQAR